MSTTSVSDYIPYNLRLSTVRRPFAWVYMVRLAYMYMSVGDVKQGCRLCVSTTYVEPASSGTVAGTNTLEMVRDKAVSEVRVLCSLTSH